MQRRTFAAVVTAVLCISIGLTLSAFPASAAGSEARIGMPFTGNFANSLSDPVTHPVYFAGGQWSTDLYAPEGTNVAINVVAASDPVVIKVDNAGPLDPCEQKSPGSYAKLGIYIGGARIGQVLYEHLNGLQVSTGQTIPNGQVLGKTHWWPYSSCYQVSTAAGIHTHIEVGSSSGTACYVGRPLGTRLTPTDTVGAVGGGYTTKRCPSPLPALDLPESSATLNPLMKEVTAPAVVQRPNGETDVIAAGADGSLRFWFNAYGSSSWNSLLIAGPGYARSAPAVVQRSNGETDVVVVASDNSLDYWYNAYETSTWNKLDITVADRAYSAPAVVQRSNGETDVVVVGPNGKLDYYWNNFGQPAWQWMPIVATAGYAMSAPAVVQRSNGETDVVVLASDNSLDYWYNALGSSAWNRLDVTNPDRAYSAPAVFQNATSGETGVAIVGPGNKLDYYWNTFGQSSWNWVSIASSNTGFAAPDIIQRSGGEVDVVSVGQNNTLDFYYSANGHGAWNPLAIRAAGNGYSAPTIIQRPSNETDVIVRGPSNRLDYYFNFYGQASWQNLLISNN